jgi:hypothetical protein
VAKTAGGRDAAGHCGTGWLQTLGEIRPPCARAAFINCSLTRKSKPQITPRGRENFKQIADGFAGCAASSRTQALDTVRGIGSIKEDTRDPVALR